MLFWLLWSAAVLVVVEIVAAVVALEVAVVVIAEEAFEHAGDYHEQQTDWDLCQLLI